MKRGASVRPATAVPTSRLSPEDPDRMSPEPTIAPAPSVDPAGREVASPARGAWRADLLPMLVGVLVVLLREGHAVPHRNELFYLVRLYHTYHPGWLGGDWTLAGGAPEHFLYNHVVGLLGVALPLAALGWVGRVLVWALGVWAILRLARRLDVPRWGAVAGFAVWIGFGQSLVADSWMFMTLEAKTVAYPLLLLALERLVAGRPGVAGLLGGLAASLHPSVGLFGGMALAAAALVARPPFRAWGAFGGLAVVGALPGVLAVLPTVGGGHADWTLLALTRMPFHLDPLSWPGSRMIGLGFLLGFALLHAATLGGRGWRIVAGFQVATALAFAAGIAIRVAGPVEWLQLFPFRLFPLLTPLLVLLALAHTVSRLDRVLAGPSSMRTTTTRVGLALLAALTLMSLPDPVSPWVKRVSRLGRAPNEPPGLLACYAWARDHTMPGSVGVAPPGLDARAWVTSERGYVVNTEFHIYDRFGEWRERVEALGGPIPAHDAWRDDLLAHYVALSEDDVRAIADRWDVDFWISSADYALPVGTTVDGWTVYLPPRSGDRAGNDAADSSPAWSSMATTR